MAATQDKKIFIERFLPRVNRFFSLSGPVPKGPLSDGEYPKTFDRVSVCYIQWGASPGVTFMQRDSPKYSFKKSIKKDVLS